LVGYEYPVWPPTELPTVLASFWDVNTSGQTTSDGGTPKTTAEMHDPNTFMDAGWDFIGKSDGTSDIWAEPSGGGYPILLWQLSPLPPLPTFSGGSGTINDPYLISTPNDLNRIGHNPRLMRDHFQLINDINLRDINFFIIGAYGYPYCGVFDGNGHTILNFTYDSNDRDYVGLLGYVDGGEIRNLGLIYPDIDAGTERYVGSLVGFLRDGTIMGSYVEGGSVSGDEHVGGLVGENSGTIRNCYATGSVIGNRYVGGLVGYNYNGSVWNCYTTGSVSGSGVVGGLVAGNHGGNISNSYSTGDVSGDGDVGGLVGKNTSSVSNCFWDANTQTHGVIDSIGYDLSNTVTNVSSLPTTLMQTKSTFTDAGWDFVGERHNGTTETWQMPAGGGYPVLSFFHIDIPFPLAGSGTAAQPYLVSDANELGMVSWYPVHCYFKLTGYVDLSGINWSVPVVPAFSGCFNGNDCIISSMQISGGGYLGLFGVLRDQGRIRSLCIDGASVSGNGSNVGGLVGFNDLGIISNCHFTGSLSGGYHVGGLVGCNHRGIVSDCYSTALVSGEDSVGGLVGLNYNDGGVSNCHSTGDVSGLDYVGGLVGRNHSSLSKCFSIGDVNGVSCVGGLVGGTLGSVSNCYSTGAVSGGQSVGGLAGFDHGIISNCYSTSSVTCDGYYVGGLVGDIFYGSMSNCYSTGSVNGVSEVGGLVGYNAGSFSNCYSISSVSGDDYVGGLVGQNGYSSLHIKHPGYIYNSYSTGRVQGDLNIGGLVGKHEYGAIERSFWDVNTSDLAYSDGGEGKTTAQMQTQSTFTDVGWEFVSVWDITCEGINYPRFLWQIPIGDFLCPDGVNFVDFSFFAGHWAEDNCGVSNDCEGTDLDLLGTVDINDLRIFVDNWLRGF
jgi:hypothetical protein